MQSAVRLERYLHDQPGAPVAAIVLLHSHNDPSDNVTFETVRRGLREYVESPRCPARLPGPACRHPHAPDWYVEPIRGIVGETADAGDVRWCGRVPAEKEFSGPENNDHSGSHFTPELNGYYARKIHIWLTEGCAPT